jgi:transcriptional regulator with XRE-family HTH domain
MAPRINPWKEYESTLNEYRIAAGLTHKELAVKSNIPSPTICALANGTLAPIKENGSGQLRKDAQKLCEFFDVSPEDLFPRYVCSFNQSYKFEIQPYETWSERAADNCGVRLENHDLAWLLIKKGMADASSREKRVFIGYLFNNKTFTDIAHKECVTTVRIIQNFKNSLRRITDAAKKIGLPIDTKSWMLTIKQRFE